jgi:hypothetical protein
MLRSGIVVSAVAALVVWTGTAVAQEQADVPAEQPAGSDELPSAESLFEQHRELVGGDEAFENVSSREIKGRVRNDEAGFLARIHIWAVAPNMIRTDVDAPGVPARSTIYDGEVGWVSVDGKHRLVEGMELVDLALTADFFGEANYKERYKEMETIGVGTFTEREVYIVECVSKGGKRSRTLFDTETGFVVGAQTSMTSEAGAMPAFLILEDYEDIGGMLWPTTIIQATGGGETVISAREITVNEVDESVFERPEAVDKLLAEKADGDG